MKMKDTQVHTGGLMRCCVQTIATYITEHSQDEVKDMRMDCMFEPKDNEQIALIGGIWQWAGMKRSG